MGTFKNSRSAVFLIVCICIFINNISGQNTACNTITADMNFTVGSVTITGRWVPVKLQEKVEKLIGVGLLFDPATVGLAEQLVREEIVNNEGNFAMRLLGSTSVLFITSDICPVEGSLLVKKVAIVIHPYYLRIDLYNIGNNILPIPRTAKPTFYRQVPSILLATSPSISIVNDRRAGTAAIIQTTTDLLHIPGISAPSGSSKNLRLNINFNVRTSLNNSFYNAASVLQLIRPVYAATTMGWNFGVMYACSRQPLSVNNYNNDFTKIFGALQGSGSGLFFDKYTFGASIRFSQNKYTQQNNKFHNPETDYMLYALSDGRVGKGLARLGLWLNASVPETNNLKSYYRLAGKAGYATSLGSGHNNVDLETIIHYGYTWKTPTAYSEFFAGNVAANFLYVPLNSFNNISFPEGPVVRSLGEKEGGIPSVLNTVSGGTSYWGLNLTFAIPVSKWAHPLIPDIVMEESPRRITIRSALKAQVTTAKSAIADDLAINGGLSDSEADATAERIVDKDIKPTINYLADRANIYSVKPVIFFDVGEINKRNMGDRIWTAAGLGLQINIVNARLEMGYVQTLFPKSDDAKGNFLIRFSVQNFY